MKRRNDRLGNGQAAHDLVDEFSHLPCRFVGEGDGENRLRHRTNVLNQMSNAVGDDASLSAAGAGQNEHWPVSGFNSFALLWVELRHKRQLGFTAPKR